MDLSLIEKQLKEEKLCPSQLGLQDYYILECTDAECFTSCDSCREMAVLKAKK